MFQASSLNRRNDRVQGLYRNLFGLMTLLLILPVLIILGMLIYKGGSALSMDFLFTDPTDGMTAGGIFPALVGTVWLVSVALLISVPLGVAAAIYLSEYAADNWFTRIINLAIINLAGVPSIVHALFGVGAFVIFFGFGTSILAASLTLAIMTLPVVIVATRESLQAVPAGLPRGLLEHGCHPLADHPPGGAAQRGQRHPHRCHPGGIPHHRRDRTHHVHRRRLLHPLPAPERVRPDHGHVPAPVRGRHPGPRRARTICPSVWPWS